MPLLECCFCFSSQVVVFLTYFSWKKTSASRKSKNLNKTLRVAHQSRDASTAYDVLSFTFSAAEIHRQHHLPSNHARNVTDRRRHRSDHGAVGEDRDTSAPVPGRPRQSPEALSQRIPEVTWVLRARRRRALPLASSDERFSCFLNYKRRDCLKYSERHEWLCSRRLNEFAVLRIR